MAAPVGFDVHEIHTYIHTYIHTITPVIFDGRAGHFRWPRWSFSMAAPVIFDGRAGRFRWPRNTYIHTYKQLRRSISMAAPVIFDGRAGHFRWPRWSFSMAAPVAAMAAPVAAIATHLCPYEAQYICNDRAIPVRPGLANDR